MYGAIEAGGTKFVCAVSDDPMHIAHREVIPTTTPNETIARVAEFFNQYDLTRLAIGSFGPIDINESSPTYGYITSTPKEKWRDFDFLGTMKEKVDCPIVWTTDVNVAAYGEYVVAGADKSCLYLTVGTGIGGGYVQDGEFLAGYTHPEMGHIYIVKDPDDDTPGWCPYHADQCLEGLASGSAIRVRSGQGGETLPDDDPSWDFIADYLAQACLTFTYILSPERIVLGGSVMKQRQLFPKIRQKFIEKANGYSTFPDADDYIVPPELGDLAGITGALLLARDSEK